MMEDQHSYGVEVDVEDFGRPFEIQAQVVVGIDAFLPWLDDWKEPSLLDKIFLNIAGQEAGPTMEVVRSVEARY